MRVDGPSGEPNPETQTAEGENGTVERLGRPVRAAAKQARDYVRAVAFHEQNSDQD